MLYIFVLGHPQLNSPPKVACGEMWGTHQDPYLFAPRRTYWPVAGPVQPKGDIKAKEYYFGDGASILLAILSHVSVVGCLI